MCAYISTINKLATATQAPQLPQALSSMEKKQVAPPSRRIDLYVIFLFIFFYLGLRSETRTRTEVVTIFNRTKYLGRPVRTAASDNEFIYRYILFFCKQPPETGERCQRFRTHILHYVSSLFVTMIRWR